MKKKVAIMTWFTYKNYGTVLQASAIYNTIYKMNYDPFMIFYLPKGTIEDDSFKHIIKKVITKIRSKQDPIYLSDNLEQLYDDYIEDKFCFTKECFSYSDLYDLNDEYSVFLCGSDQIWSPLSFDDKYFLSFVKESNKMIAYAPSFGGDTITNSIIRENMVKYISRFKHLSVREQQGADLIKKITGQETKVVLDPTLLMDSFEWDEYVKINEVKTIVDTKYILCYFLGESSKYMGYVRNLARSMEIPYYVVPITLKQKRSGESVPFDIGPREFVSLIRNAKYVITDSFHGMAFAVNYNVPFSVFKRFKDSDPKNQNSRIISLLKMLDLEERLVDYRNKKNIQTEIECDFTEANRRLAIKRRESKEFLDNSFESAEKVCINRNEKTFKITDICCGCGACASVCGKDAITIVRDEEGFEHYKIDMEKCVRCEQCRTVCPMTGISALNMRDSSALYSIKTNSQQIIKNSSSGGVGYEIALYLMGKEYAVCGCMYDNENKIAKHIWIMPSNKESLSLLQGSKYIQSSTFEAMNRLISIAKRQKVVFFGTPCQSAAADKLLRKKQIRDKAIIVDLICHGVPSYHLWNKYLDKINEEYNVGKHPNVMFRSKEREWKKRLMIVTGNGNVFKKEERHDDFYAFFRRGLCDMSSCSDCPYRERTAADLRIGDYWGEKFEHDKQGVSMVIANTDCGNGLINELIEKNICDINKQELSEYWKVQYPYNPRKYLAREQLIRELKDYNTDLHKLRKKYCKYYDIKETILIRISKIKKMINRHK